MAHSIQAFGGRSATFNDLDLLAVVSLLMAECEQSRYEELGSVVGSWQDALRGYGPGVVDLDLDAISPTAKFELIAALAAIEIVVARSTFVRGSILDARCNAPGVKFADQYPTHYVLKAIEALRSLLS
jgi:hypothetical protein